MAVQGVEQTCASIPTRPPLGRPGPLAALSSSAPSSITPSIRTADRCSLVHRSIKVALVDFDLNQSADSYSTITTAKPRK